MFCTIVLVVIAVMAVALQSANAYLSNGRFRNQKLRASRLLASMDSSVTVRFINTPNGEDVIVRNVDQGAILLAVGDNAGVRLPRACRTGLCGSCTCDIQDPSAVQSEFNQRAGYLTIRACSARCVPPEGMNELVVDVGRMRKIKRKIPNAPGSQEEQEYEQIDPMARFADNWETEFKPAWVLNQLQQQDTQQAIPYTREGGFTPKEYKKRCMHCNGTGRVICDHCDGEGRMMVGNGQKYLCVRCAGSTTCGCGFCRGSGRVFKKLHADSS